jgi:pimeloyl-ACP methyl ester carboxylesterase
MHVRGDLVSPIEAGRALAAGLPGARFVAFQGQNHLFLEKEQASQRFLEEIQLFLGVID